MLPPLLNRKEERLRGELGQHYCSHYHLCVHLLLLHHQNPLLWTEWGRVAEEPQARAEGVHRTREMRHLSENSNVISLGIREKRWLFFNSKIWWGQSLYVCQRCGIRSHKKCTECCMKTVCRKRCLIIIDAIVCMHLTLCTCQQWPSRPGWR